MTRKKKKKEEKKKKKSLSVMYSAVHVYYARACVLIVRTCVVDKFGFALSGANAASLVSAL